MCVCVCELKRKPFLRLINACKKVKDLKKLLRELDSIETQYLIEAINCHRRALQKKGVFDKRYMKKGSLLRGVGEQEEEYQFERDLIVCVINVEGLMCRWMLRKIYC